MVDDSRDNGHNSSKSRAYDTLTAQLQRRDKTEFQLSLLHHQQKLQKCYSKSLKEGWSVDDMASEQSMSWLHDQVMWRIEQSGAVYFDEDYYSLAYDDCVATGVLITDDGVRGVNLQQVFDSADSDDMDDTGGPDRPATQCYSGKLNEGTG